MLDRRQPPRQPLQLPVARQQIRVGTGVQVRGKQSVNGQVSVGERDRYPIRDQHLAHTVDSIGSVPTLPSCPQPQ